MGKRKIQTMSTKCQYNPISSTLEIVIFPDIKRNHTHDHHTTNDMEGMKARCCKIEGPENIFSQSYPTINLG